MVQKEKNEVVLNGLVIKKKILIPFEFVGGTLYKIFFFLIQGAIVV